jgi:hypothetical protein
MEGRFAFTRFNQSGAMVHQTTCRMKSCEPRHEWYFVTPSAFDFPFGPTHKSPGLHFGLDEDVNDLSRRRGPCAFGTAAVARWTNREGPGTFMMAMQSDFPPRLQRL